MPITEQEKLGIADLLVNEEQNVPVLLQVARSVTKNICDVTTTQGRHLQIYKSLDRSLLALSISEALDYVYVQIGDTITLLNKRAITREMLFKYLHQRKIQVNTDFSKGAIISKVIEYWNRMAENKFHPSPSSKNTEISETKQHFTQITKEIGTQNEITTACETNNGYDKESHYPIHILARKFTEWFFKNLNEKGLKIDDFWSDSQLQLRIAATDSIKDYECAGASEVIDSLFKSKEQFGFYFNPNLTHAGVQGRMNVHGLVLVLACGTLHTEQNCVGVFECTFGLLRDPFAENNWKVKTMQCILRSQSAAVIPSLCGSEALKDALNLPIPEGEIL